MKACLIFFSLFFAGIHSVLLPSLQSRCFVSEGRERTGGKNESIPWGLMSSVSVDCLNEAVQREAAPMRGWVIGGWEERGAEVFIWRTVRVSWWQGRVRLPPSPLKRLCIHAGICSKCQESWFVFLFVFSYQSILRFWIDAHSHILNDNSRLRQDLKKPFEISALFIKTQYGIGLLFCSTGLLRRRVNYFQSVVTAILSIKQKLRGCVELEIWATFRLKSISVMSSGLVKMVWNSGIAGVQNNPDSKKKYFCLYGNIVFYSNAVFCVACKLSVTSFSFKLHSGTARYYFCCTNSVWKQTTILPSCLRSLFSFHSKVHTKVFFFPPVNERFFT